MRELSLVEVDMVSGGNALTFVRNSVVGGVIYDGLKSVGGWIGSTFFARDGSSGSRYPIEKCAECGS